VPRIDYEHEPVEEPAKSRSELALEFRCPFCKAQSGDPCRYRKVKRPDWRTGNEKSWMRFHLNGMPTDRPHIDRYNVIDAEVRKRRLKAERKLQKFYSTVHKDKVRTLQSIREFDRVEAYQLATWLRVYGDIFQELIPKERADEPTT
jgi:hypothetical protein